MPRTARTSRFLACISCHAEDSADKTERGGGATWRVGCSEVASIHAKGPMRGAGSRSPYVVRARCLPPTARPGPTLAAPVVPGSFLLGSALDLRRDMLAACEREFQRYGDAVRF